MHLFFIGNSTLNQRLHYIDRELGVTRELAIFCYNRLSQKF